MHSEYSMHSAAAMASCYARAGQQCMMLPPGLSCTFPSLLDSSGLLRDSSREHTSFFGRLTSCHLPSWSMAVPQLCCAIRPLAHISGDLPSRAHASAPAAHLQLQSLLCAAVTPPNDHGSATGDSKTTHLQQCASSEC